MPVSPSIAYPEDHVRAPRLDPIIASSSWPWILLATGLSAVFTLQLLHFPAFYGDDGFISLRYSARLIHGQGLTWNDLRPVEGYSNLLWVLACAALGAIGIPLPFASLLLGISCSLLAILAVAAHGLRDYQPKQRFIAVALGCGSLVLSGPFAVWTKSALEQPMLAAFLGWAMFFGIRWAASFSPSAKDITVLSFLLACTCLVRADGAVFAAGLFLGGVFADGPSIKSIVYRSRVLALPVLFVMAQLLFRRLYYGEWLPNTAYVKVAFTAQRVFRGLKYDARGFSAEAVFFVLAVLGLIALWKYARHREVCFLLTPALIWLLYVTVIGGDIFSYGRHFIPILAILAFAVPGCVLLSIESDTFRRLRVPVICVSLLAVSTSDLFCRPDNFVATGRSVALFLKQAFDAQQPLITSDAAGVVPFYTNFPAIDPLGLNDYHIARHKTPQFGRGILGHEVADGAYVLDQRPDILIFSGYYSAILLESDRQITSDPRFPLAYQPVRFDTTEPPAIRSVVYLRRFGGKLGVQTAQDHISIPAYLAEMKEANSVRIVDGLPKLVLPPKGSAEFLKIQVPAGLWKFQMHADNPAAIELLDQPSGTQLADTLSDGKSTLSFSLQNESGSSIAVDTIELVRR